MIIMLIWYFVFSSSTASPSDSGTTFSLTKTNSFTHQLQSPILKVPYFVTDSTFYNLNTKASYKKQVSLLYLTVSTHYLV